MKRSLPTWQFAGFLFTALAGTLLHFAYDWSGRSLFFAFFSAVNESIWEHMKLLFYPMFVFGLAESLLFGAEYEGFWCAKLAGMLLGLVLIPVLYYTYTGVFGVMLDWINITIFFVSAAAAYWLETRLLTRNNLPCAASWLPLLLLCLLGLTFVRFTFYPPQIPLFADPISGLYGVGA